MTQKDVLKLQTFQQTAEVLNNNPSVFESDESTKAQIVVFNTNVDSLLKYQSLINQPTKWLTQEKNDQLLIIRENSHLIIVALMRLANDTKNTELIEKVSQVKSEITKTSNTLILKGATRLYNLTEKYATPLPAYGITVEFTAAYKQSINLAENKLAERKRIKDQNKQNTEAFKELMKATSSFLTNKLDWSIESYRTAQPELTTAYFTARKTLKTPIQHIDVRGFIIDKETGANISFGTVSVVEKDMQTKITEKGNFVFKNFPEGEFTLKVENINYETVMLTIRRYSNQYLNIKVEMKAIPVPFPV
jgi:hypothetical protein